MSEVLRVARARWVTVAGFARKMVVPFAGPWLLSLTVTGMIGGALASAIWLPRVPTFPAGR